MIIKNKRTNQILEVLPADNFISQTAGLSWKREKKNMLFRMPYKWKWSFWMFGMFYPLKICFLGEDGKVFEILDAEPLSLNPKTWKIYKPKKACRYILEISDNFDAKKEDVLEF